MVPVPRIKQRALLYYVQKSSLPIQFLSSNALAWLVVLPPEVTPDVPRTSLRAPRSIVSAVFGREGHHRVHSKFTGGKHHIHPSGVPCPLHPQLFMQAFGPCRHLLPPAFGLSNGCVTSRVGRLEFLRFFRAPLPPAC